MVTVEGPPSSRGGGFGATRGAELHETVAVDDILSRLAEINGLLDECRDAGFGRAHGLEIISRRSCCVGGQGMSISFAIARAPHGPLEKVSFGLSADAEEAFMRINRIMQAQKGDYWSTCQMMVERDGRYDFKFDYGPPYRLSGNLNDTRYRDYLDRYAAEMGQR